MIAPPAVEEIAFLAMTVNAAGLVRAVSDMTRLIIVSGDTRGALENPYGATVRVCLDLHEAAVPACTRGPRAEGLACGDRSIAPCLGDEERRPGSSIAR
jgi:hypothetical protein